MGEFVKLSKISQFTMKQQDLQPLYKCTHGGKGRVQMRVQTAVTGARFSYCKGNCGMLLKSPFDLWPC